MADPDTPDERLAELRRRWEANPTARAGLHLAEEYRRIGRLEQALEVLTAGLEENPDHLAAQVALGKTRLEMGDAATAAEVFSAVVDKDPTHIVANRLLIEAHLRRGEAAAARQRLEHYRLLGADAGELEELESRVAATSPPPPPPPAAPSEASAAAGDGRDESAPETAEPAAAPSVRRPQGEPFSALLGAVDLGRHLESLGDAGLFPVILPPPAPEPLPVPEPQPEAELPVAEARAAAEVQPAAEPEVVGAAEPSPAAVAEPESEAEPEAVAAAAAPEAAAEPQADSAAAEEPPAAAAAAAVAEESAPAGPLPAAADDERRATVTLGNLYLSQRHYAEAERIFRQVLERRPGDAAAERGLAEAQRHQTRTPSAEELVRWAEREGKLPPAEAGQQRRTAALLRAYVDRLREREAGGVS